MPEVWYRYEDRSYSTGGDENGYSTGTQVQVHLRIYEVLRHTPCGVWLSMRYGDFGVIGERDERFVLKRATKRWACPTVEEAMDSYMARKRRQLKIYLARADRVRRAIVAGEMIDPRRRAAPAERDVSASSSSG